MTYFCQRRPNYRCVTSHPKIIIGIKRTILNAPLILVMRYKIVYPTITQTLLDYNHVTQKTVCPLELT